MNTISKTMQQLLLLHGAIGTSLQMLELVNELTDTFTVQRLNFSGHGGSPFAGAPFSIPLFAGEVISFLDKKGIEAINIFGYSMGGYVAMYLAKYHAKRILKIITLATKFTWDEAIAAK